MNLEFSLPKAKRFCSANATYNPFPVNSDENDDNLSKKEFTGIFTGLNVHIIDETSIKEIYTNGCFGLSAKSKKNPKVLSAETHVETVTQSQFQRKLEWNTKYGNQNQNNPMIKLVPDENISNNDDIDMESNEPNILIDPFPIEDSLALMPEEAFFLHFALNCLKIVNVDQTVEFNTETVVDKFCNLSRRFIERYITYHYYRSRNWIVKSGVKFGGDFRKYLFHLMMLVKNKNISIQPNFNRFMFQFTVLYYKGPNYYHASYVVLICDNEIHAKDAQSNYRVADSTGKELIILNIIRPIDLEYSNRMECLTRLNEFKITEVIPKRFVINQLNAQTSK